jgi:hypothetical protein
MKWQHRIWYQLCPDRTVDPIIMRNIWVTVDGTCKPGKRPSRFSAISPRISSSPVRAASKAAFADCQVWFFSTDRCLKLLSWSWHS